MPLYRVQEFFPLIITQHIGALSDTEWRARQALDSDMLKTNAQIGLQTTSIYDMSAMETPTPTQREMAADYMREHLDWIQAVELGTAFIVPNVLLRGVLTAVFWLQGYPVPRVLVKDWGSALSWCLSRFDEAGVAYPKRLREGGMEVIRPQLYGGAERTPGGFRALR